MTIASTTKILFTLLLCNAYVSITHLRTRERINMLTVIPHRYPCSCHSHTEHTSSIPNHASRTSSYTSPIPTPHPHNSLRVPSDQYLPLPRPGIQPLPFPSFHVIATPTDPVDLKHCALIVHDVHTACPPKY